jgi:hypothetical protein
MEIKLSVGPLRAVRAGVPSIAADVLPIAGVARHVSNHILREVRFKGFCRNSGQIFSCELPERRSSYPFGESGMSSVAVMWVGRAVRRDARITCKSLRHRRWNPSYLPTGRQRSGAHAARSRARTAKVRQITVNNAKAMLSTSNTVGAPVPSRLKRSMSTCHVIGLPRAIH